MHGAWGCGDQSQRPEIAIIITQSCARTNPNVNRKLLCIIMFEQILRQYIFIRSVGAHFNRDASGAEKNLSAAFMHHVRVWVCVSVYHYFARLFIFDDNN